MSYEKKRIKMAFIAGAAHALTYKKKHPTAMDEEVIQHLNREANDLLSKVDAAE